MNNAWSIEFTRLFVVLFFTAIIEMFFSPWFIVTLIPIALYITWILFQLQHFEQWLKQDACISFAPNASGIFEVLTQHIHRAQKQHQKEKEAFKRFSDNLHSIITALPDATVVLNSNLEIQWSNQASNVLLGIKSSQDIGQRIDNLIRKPELQQLFNTESNKHEIEMTGLVDLNNMLQIQVVEFGLAQRLLIARDISQQKNIQTLRKDFISNASHELRTPLTVISGYLEILEMNKELPKNVLMAIENAHIQALRMRKILDDMLQLYQLEETEHPQKNLTQFCFSTFIYQCVSDFEQTSENHSFNLNIEKNISINANLDDIQSLLDNLLSNAIKYSPPHSTISIYLKISEIGVSLCIKDQGEGIAEQEISRLTERFYRVNVYRKSKVSGTGLGLSIVKHILDNMDGSLLIESQIGKGSTFTAQFPKKIINVT